MVPAAAPAPLVIEENWVSCDTCLKWRLLPLDTKPDQLPENWLCSMLFWMPGMNRCEIPEEETTNVMRALYQMVISEGQSNIQNHATGTATGVSSVITGPCVKDDSNSGSIAENKLASEIVPAAAAAPLVIEENWVSCDSCLKWRLLPLDTKPDQLPENWLCSMLFWVPGMNRCEIAEEETTRVMRALYQMLISEGQSNMQNHATGTATGVSSVDAGPCVKDDSNSGSIAENKLASEIVPAAAAAAPLVIEENWVSCDSCLKWRLLPLYSKPDQFPENWLCSMLFWVPGMNRCEIPEEETTNVMRSFYQRLISEGQGNMQNHATGTVTGMSSVDVGPEEETTRVMRDLYQLLISEGQSNMQNHATGTATGMSSVDTGPCVKDDSNSGSIAENKLASEIVPAAAEAPLVIEENWVSCDSCLKWRLLPLYTKPDQLPENWLCSMLFWVPGMNRCEIPEEETTRVMRALYQMLISEGQSNMQNHATGTATGMSSVDAGPCVKDDSNSGSIAENKLAPEMVPAAAGAPLVVEENWVRCDSCLKWRLLPLDTKPDQLPENWLCSMLFWVPGMNWCEIPEEETTNVMRSFYQRLISEGQSNTQNHATGTATGVSSVDDLQISLNHQNPRSDVLSDRGKEKHGFMEKTQGRKQ